MRSSPTLVLATLRELIEAINAKLMTLPNIYLYVLKINEPCFVSFLVLVLVLIFLPSIHVPFTADNYRVILRQGILLHITS